MKQNTIIFILLLIPFIGFTQDGTLDPSFGNGGIVETDFYGFLDISLAVSQQNNGKIISGGVIVTENDSYMASLVRYNSDGILDNTFGDNGMVLFDFGGNYIDNLFISTLDNDDLIAAGTYGVWEEKDFLIQKFLANGDLDIDFGMNGIVTTDFFNDNDILLGLIVQEDEKYLAIGRSEQGSDYFISFVKYLPSGELDTTFGINGKLSLDINNNYPSSISASLQFDNSIIVSFSENLNSNTEVLKVFKIFENGDLDSSFGVDGIIEIEYNNVDNIASILEVDPNNNILIVATLYYGETNEYSTLVTRFNENGIIDSSFGESGTFDFNLGFYAHKIIIQPNSRILIGGGVPEFEGSAFILKRLFNNGSIDNSLVGSAYSYFQSSDLILQNDGKILATGSTYWFDGDEDFVLVRFNNDPLGIEDQQLQNFIIYPNPSNGIFKINHDFINSSTHYHITDISGKVIQTGSLTGEQTVLDLSIVQSGMYLFTASGSTFRLIKN